MKTLADFKRRLKVGVNLHTIYHQKFSGNRDEKGQPLYTDEDKGIREISIVKSTQFAIKTTKSDGTIVDSWCAYPTTKNLIIVDENTVTILEPDWREKDDKKRKLIPILTHKFI